MKAYHTGDRFTDQWLNRLMRCDKSEAEMWFYVLYTRSLPRPHTPSQTPKTKTFSAHQEEVEVLSPNTAWLFCFVYR